MAPHFIYFAWYHANGFEMCNEKKTKGEKNKDELPQGNHYHTSLLLTTHCSDWMLDAVRCLQSRKKAFKGSISFEF